MLGIIGALALAAAGTAHGAPIATLDTGKVEGVAVGDVRIFRGIPYAAPPVGALRWRAPEPASPWNGIRPTRTFGASCPQGLSSPTQMSALTAVAEDCLTLNVWAPQDDSTRHPVMVWLHGGGFFTGSGAEAQFDGSVLARRGIVVITINYRLGRLGFFAHPALLKETAGAPTGNFALLDQIAALRWVQANAAAFSGDPAKVTIFGESAGGMSVAALMTSPLARGLFAKAIIQSGAISYPARDLAAAARTGAAWASSIGIAGEDVAALDALRALPVERIAPSKPSLGDVIALQSSSTPIVDGVLLPKLPRDAFRAGEEANVPLVIGSTGSETQVWQFTDPMSLVTIVPLDAAALLGAMPNGAAVVEEYTRSAGGDRALGLRQLESDMFVGSPTRWMAERHSNSAPTWLYRFDAVPTPGLEVTRSAPHGTDLWYVFGTLDSLRVHPERLTEADRSISNRMVDAWANFAKTGVPAPADIWPPYRRGGQLLLVTNAGVAAAAVPHGDFLLRIEKEE